MSKSNSDYNGCLSCWNSKKMNDGTIFCKIMSTEVEKGNSCFLNSDLPDNYVKSIGKIKETIGEDYSKISIFAKKEDMLIILDEEEGKLERENWVPNSEMLETISFYSSMFRVGDAIFVDNEWKEVVSKKGVLFAKKGENSNYPTPINFGKKDNYKGNVEGFNNEFFEVSTLYDLELNDTDKLVWLGSNTNFWGTEGASLIKGNSYKPFLVKGEWFIKDEVKNEFPVFLDNYTKPTMQKVNDFRPLPWGVIPKYKRILEK